VRAFLPLNPCFGLQMQRRSRSQPSVRADANENRAELRPSCFFCPRTTRFMFGCPDTLSNLSKMVA